MSPGGSIRFACSPLCYRTYGSQSRLFHTPRVTIDPIWRNAIKNARRIGAADRRAHDGRIEP